MQPDLFDNPPNPPGMTPGVIFATQRPATPRTSAPHFYRCGGCLSVFTLEDRAPASLVCACGSSADGTGDFRHAIEYLGQAKGDRMTKEIDRCPCDGRCTGAIGPDCDCRCDGMNHGTGRLVRVTIDTGEAPRVTLRASDAEKAKAALVEFNDGIRAAQERMTAKFGDRLEAYRQRVWLKPETWNAINRDLELIREAKVAKLHRNRLKKLSQVAA